MERVRVVITHDWVDFVTLIVAILAGAVIAYQAWKTRQSLQLSQAAMEVGRNSLQVSHMLAVESTRARLDQGLPPIRVSLDSPEWPPRELMNIGEPQPIRADREFVLPREQDLVLVLRAEVRVVNDSDQPIPIDSGLLLQATGHDGNPLTYEPLPSPFELEAGDDRSFVLQLQAPLLTWKIVYQQRASGEKFCLDPAGEGRIFYSDGRDCGINVVYPLRIRGFPIEAVPQTDDLWRLTQTEHGLPTNPMRCEPVLLDVHYYLSKRSSNRLPEAPTLPVGLMARPTKSWWRHRL